jgi:hypothetical protein
MRTLLVVFAVALGALLLPRSASATDTTRPTCKIVDSIISSLPGGGTFTYYIKAADETRLAPYAIAGQ